MRITVLNPSCDFRRAHPTTASDRYKDSQGNVNGTCTYLVPEKHRDLWATRRQRSRFTGPQRQQKLLERSE